MTSKNIKMEKITFKSAKRALRNRNANKTTVLLKISSYLLLQDNAAIVLLIALICSTTLSFDEVHFKHEQPQVLLTDSHATIGTIQQTEEAANVH